MFLLRLHRALFFELASITFFFGHFYRIAFTFDIMIAFIRSLTTWTFIDLMGFCIDLKLVIT